MRLRDDERAVTVQIGAVLLLGFVVISMSMYQATVVPDQNEEIEFQHNQQVHDEFTSLRGQIVTSATERAARPATVSLGTRYPSRTFFVNPGVASGSLRTRELGTLTVSNVSTVGSSDTGDYVAGDNLSFSTNALEYRPNYNVFQSAPTTVYESTVAYNRFDNGYNGTLAGQSLVNGRRISLVLLQGNYSEAGSGRATVNAEAVSPATRTVSVTSNASSRNVTVTVPTELSAQDWRTLLDDAGQLDGANNTSGAYVHAVREADGDAVTLVMERGATYDLRIGAVGVGTGVEEPDAHYLTVVEPESVSLGGTGAQTVVFEVRDRYNNPVSGQQVNFSTTDSSVVTVSKNDATTDEDGRVSVTVQSAGIGNADVRASFVRDSGYVPSSRTDAGVHVDAFEGAGGGGTGSSESLYDVQWNTSRIDDAPGVSYDGASTLTVDRSNATIPVQMYANATGDDGPVDNVELDFATNDSGVAGFNAGNGVTDGSGRASVGMSSSEDGDASVYVSGHEDGDRLTVEVVTGSGGGGGGEPEDPGFAYDDVDGDGTYDPEKDSKIPDSELADGQYDAGSDQLVVPTSSSDISASNIDFRGDKGVYLGPNVTATAGGATGTITIDGGDGDIVVAGASLDANGDNADVSLSTNGNIDVRNSTVVGHGDVRLSATGWINASGALLHANKDQSNVILESSGDDIRLTDATLKATRKGQTTTSPQNDVTATVPNDPSQYTVFVGNATFVDSDNKLDVTPNGAESGTPASGEVV